MGGVRRTTLLHVDIGQASNISLYRPNTQVFFRDISLARDSEGREMQRPARVAPRHRVFFVGSPPGLRPVSRPSYKPALGKPLAIGCAPSPLFPPKSSLHISWACA